MSVVSTQVDGDILVIIANNPPVNALGAAVRAGLRDAIISAQSDGKVRAIVVRCDGRTFFAGADITEFGKPPVSPSLPEVVDTIEASQKPVVAAIHGTALGGGLEVALGCHYRVAARSAKLGLPEVKLGILPGAGGTQRLPRIVGVGKALEMIVTGEPIAASEASECRLVDEIADDAALLTAASAFARRVAGADTHLRTSVRNDRIESAEKAEEIVAGFRTANARRLRGFEAPAACIEAVQAASRMPYAQGVQRERELFLKLVAGAQSKALRHVFFAERAAAKIDDIPRETMSRQIKKVGVLGAGTMGGGIAMNFLSAGLPVVIVEREKSALERGVETIRKNYFGSVSRGRMSESDAERAVSLLTPSLDTNDFADCDLVIEAVFELMDIKKDVFKNLDKIVKDGAILATNTSYLDINEIAAATKRPESVLGLHFFSPANVMKLLEVVRGEKTSVDALKTAMSLAKRIGKIAVVAGVCYGFIGNRMLAVRRDQAHALLMEGAKPWEIDRVLTAFGMPMGPFQISDLAGLDIGWDPEKSNSSTIREVLCERGRRGQKTGKGYYDYDESRRGSPSQEVEDIIAGFVKTSGAPQRDISDAEIFERLVYPMINEGAKILDEGIAQRASDIDLVWINGYGWPAYTGGPMFWAEENGLDQIVSGLKRHASALGAGFEISTLLLDKAAKGARFDVD